MIKKICKKCKVEKPLLEFHKHKLGKFGYRAECIHCTHLREHEYRKRNKEYFRIQKKQYNNKNSDKIRKQKKSYYLANKDKILLTTKTYKQNQRKNNPNFRLLSKLRGRLATAIQRNYKIYSTKELVGCDIDQLKIHLQQTAISNDYKEFDIENYDSSKYHIDHIIPCAAWNLKCSYHQKLCFNYINLQILSAEENLLKHDKIED
jgi:hypothetical protein